VVAEGKAVAMAWTSGGSGGPSNDLIVSYEQLLKQWQDAKATLDEEWPGRSDFLIRELHALLQSLECQMRLIRSKISVH